MPYDMPFGIIMSRLVVHVGAQKCGSTTIQNAFGNFVPSDYLRHVIFRIFPPELASRIHKDFNSVTRRELDIQLSDICEEDVCLILSCEALCNYPDVVAKLVESAVNRVPEVQIVVIGYSRAQYSYYLSEYKQWFFRATGRLRQDVNFLHRNNLAPDKFLPHERRMFVNTVMSFESQRQRDWYDYYKTLEGLISGYDANVQLKSAHIPTKEINYSLVEDFVCKVNYRRFDTDVFTAAPKRVNQSFDPLLCESIALHICNQSLDSSCFPGPHDGNHLILKASNLFSKGRDDALGALEGSSTLCEVAQATIAENFVDSNEKYCDLYGINKKYFRVELPNAVCSNKEQLFTVAREVQASRSSKEIYEYERHLLAELEKVAFVFKR